MRKTLRIIATATLLLPSVITPVSAAGFTPEGNDRHTVRVAARERAEAATRSEEWGDIRVKFKYDADKYDMMQVVCSTPNYQYVIDEVDLMDDGYMHTYDELGVMTFVGILTHKAHQAVTLVIAENVDVSDGAPVVLDTADAVNFIEFKSLNMAGEEIKGTKLMIEGEETSTELDGNILPGGTATTYLYHKELGQVLEWTNGLDEVYYDGEQTYASTGGNVYVNDPGADTGFSIVQAVSCLSDEGVMIIKHCADGFRSQTVSNDPANYLMTRHDFAPHKMTGLLKNGAGVSSTGLWGAVPVWDGDIYDVSYLPLALYIEVKGINTLWLNAPAATSGDTPFNLFAIMGSYDDADAYESDINRRAMGVNSALVRATPDNRMEFINNPAVNGFRYDDWTHTEQRFNSNMEAVNPYLSIFAENGETLTWGNSAPLCVASVAYIDNSDTEFGFSFVGRNNEARRIDLKGTSFELKADNQVISTNIRRVNNDFMEWRLRNGEFNSTQAEYHISLLDTNVLVDGIEGYNKTEMYYDTNMSLCNPPSIRSLKFRNLDGTVTDRFVAAEDGVAEIYAGDFEYCFGENFGERFFNFINLNDVVVEYSPYGEDSWERLPIEEVEDMFLPVAYGNLYRASLADTELTSPNGWYDLKITVYDYNDNYMRQVISPAYNIDTNNSVRPNISGLADEDVNVFNMQGVRVASGNLNEAKRSLPSGIYVVKGAGSTFKIVI